MSKIVTYSSVNVLRNNVKVVCNIDIPVLGKETDEIYDSKSEFIFPILTNQYIDSVKKVVCSYEKSPLPSRFLVNQEILITKLPTDSGLHGVFNLIGDNIIINADTILNIYGEIPADFLFGHEMGHKIAKYKALKEVYQEIADILGISVYGNDGILSETYADECGNMVSSQIIDHGILPQPLDEYRREGIQKTILKSMYR